MAATQTGFWAGPSRAEFAAAHSRPLAETAVESLWAAGRLEPPRIEACENAAEGEGRAPSLVAETQDHSRTEGRDPLDPNPRLHTLY